MEKSREKKNSIPIVPDKEFCLLYGWYPVPEPKWKYNNCRDDNPNKPEGKDASDLTGCNYISKLEFT